MQDQRRAGEDTTSTDHRGSVLVFDYVGRRPEAPVSSLELEAYGFTVHHLLKPPRARELTAAAYADHLWRRHGPFGTEVRAVLAYCMAAPIAQEVAARLTAASGSPVPLVLFDGEPTTAESVREQYLIGVEKLGGLLSLSPARHAPAAFEPAELRDRPEQALRRMHESLLELGERAARKGTVDPRLVRTEATMVADYYLDWLSHLIAAHNASWPRWGGPAVQIVSRHHVCEAEWPGAAATETVRVDVARHDLLRHPDVASIVQSVMTKAAATGAPPHRATGNPERGPGRGI
ncbi:hypothetical protein ACIG87_25615 [Micromonospora sp. NPDC051925]|uniref:hypothetical protein n=1 Tax=Micromonospora sp. NPDC051925 TaxID=3364288 RepID=UPI0037C8D04B